MYAKRNYSPWLTIKWTSKPFYNGLLFSLFVFAVHHFAKIDISIPWQPINIIGIAVAFYLGFKNNSSYERTWEARKIYGAIVNDSRSFAAAVTAFVQGTDAKVLQKELIYRHIAWMTALRFQLRLSRPWEHVNEHVSNIYMPTVCEGYNYHLSTQMAPFVTEEELNYFMSKTNGATQILQKQTIRLQELQNQGYYDNIRHVELQQLITNLYTHQGKAERIKNFPFPRQYASTALWLTYMFSIFVPFGFLDLFHGVTGWMYWSTPLVSAIIIWIFFLMEKIGDYSENPFEGTYNDVPITQISRGIEIDIREMINDENIPGPIKEDNGFLM